MDSIKLTTAFLALILLYMPCPLAQVQEDVVQEDSAWINRSSTGPDSSFYTGETPSDAGSLIQIGTEQTYSQEKNALWIVDSGANNRQISLTIPPGVWSRMEILPKDNGSITTYEKYPAGKVKAYNLGNVSCGFRYILWFYADTPGKHEMWYSIRSGESNHVWFNVFNSSPSESQNYRYQRRD